MTTGPARSTAEAQRSRALASATRVFARTGYHATPVADIATDAGISPAYVFRLFPGKLALFTAAVEHCYARVTQALVDAAAASEAHSPGERLDAMADAYAHLIADRDLLMLQVHAQSASDIPEVRSAVRRGLAQVIAAAKDRSGADDEAVQRFVAYGQLCHLIVTADLAGTGDDPDATGATGPWVRILTAGMRHVGAPAS